MREPERYECAGCDAWEQVLAREGRDALKIVDEDKETTIIQVYYILQIRETSILTIFSADPSGDGRVPRLQVLSLGGEVRDTKSWPTGRARQGGGPWPRVNQ